MARYRHQIVIESPTETTDSYGEVSETWSEVATVWASITPIDATEAFEAGGQVEQKRFTVETYYNSIFTAKCRIKWGSRYLDIQGVNDIDTKQRKMKMTAIETDENE